MDSASNIRFHRIPDLHSVSSSLQVVVEAVNGYKIKPQDWIGLYVVGWTNPDQFIAKQELESSENSVLFGSETLPHDANNFYQLCYFDESGNLHGISSTFSFVMSEGSFLSDTMGDGVIVDMNDSDQDDVVMVKTSRNQLENALTKAIQDKISLQKQVQERDQRLSELEQEVAQLKLSNQQNSRFDELERDFNRLREQLTSGDETRLKQVAENQELSGRIRELTRQLQEQQQVGDRLEESLRNAEERLHATEDLKRMLQQEVDSVMAVQRSLASRLEDSKSEGHALKAKCQKLERDLEEARKKAHLSEERAAEIEKAQSDAVMKYLTQKELTDAAEKQAQDLRLRLEKAADEYKALYRQLHRKDGASSSQRLSDHSTPSSPLPREVHQQPSSVSASLPPNVKCPICDQFIPSSEIQQHFADHDRTDASLDVANPKCPVCNAKFPAAEIDNHVNSHFN